MWSRARLAVVVLILAACSSDKSGDGAGSVKQIRIAAASDLTQAFKDLAPKFQAKAGIEAVFDFGSTGLLARQIKEGAPMDVFAAANVSFVDEVIKAGKCDGATKALYARGRIVVWVKDGGVAPPTKIEDLADPRFKAIAIANPEHAPYGKAAKEALEKTGTWAQVESRIKLGENVSQTMKFAETGNVDAAIVALSLSIVSKGGTALAVPPELHNPIDQAIVVCGKDARAAAAKQFVDFIGSPEGRAIMMRYGFILPGEDGPAAPPP